MGIKDLLGISKWKQETELKIAFEKLEFLAMEMEKGKDRPSDSLYWKNALDLIDEMDKGQSFAITKAKIAYQMLYRLFLQKHHLIE